MLFNIIVFISGQVLLENAKSKFDANVFGAKAEVTRLTNQLRSLADQVEKCTLSSIDDLAFARREEFSTISNNLAMSFRTAYVIFEKSKAASESGGRITKLHSMASKFQ